jgi:hypothetical protein
VVIRREVDRFRYSEFLLDVLAEWRNDRRLREYGGCWACAYVPDVDRLRCVRMSAGIIDAHHVIPKAQLRKLFPFGVVLEGRAWRRAEQAEQTERAPGSDRAAARLEGWRSLDELKMDARNGMPMRRYHHNALDSGGADRLVVPWRKLPAPALEFAGELGLTVELERRYPS